MFPRYFPPVGGGGGTTIPTITANVTYNIPTDYATITAALTFIRSCVVLNGAQITINVESALIPTLNEAIAIDGEDLSYVHITNDGPVNIDTTGFVATPLGLPAWIYTYNATLGEITGTWTKTAGPNAFGVLVLESEITLGTLVGGTIGVTGFYRDVVGYAGHVDMFNFAVQSASFDQDAHAIMIGGAADYVESFGASTVAISNSTLTDNGATDPLTATLGAVIASTNNTFNIGSNVTVYKADCASINSTDDLVNITAGAPLLASSDSGTIQIRNTTTVGASLGARFTVANAGQIQGANIGAGFGADSQVPFVAVAAGMIIA